MTPYFRLIALTAFVAVASGFFFSWAAAGESENIRIAKALSNAYAEVVDMVGPAVVSIETERSVKMDFGGDDDGDRLERFFDMLPREFGDRFRRAPQGRPDAQPRKERGLGSGVVIDKAGHILTNNHVVADADKIKVQFADKGKYYDAEVVGRDPNSDVAVIILKDKPADLPVAKLGDSDVLKPGNIVIAIGSPMNFRHSVTIGVVSAKERTLGEFSFERFIQTDAAINVGNSGGPLVNLDGEVVGMNTMISSRSGGSDGIGFAIPISQAKSVITQLIEKGSMTRGYLGVAMNPEDPEISVELGGDGTGVLIADVTADSPAAKAGIRKGDLIVSFDNTPIKDNDHLRYLVADTTPGRTVPIVVLRSGEKVNLTITITAQPDDMYARARGGRDGRGGGQAPSAGEQEIATGLGVSIQSMNDTLRQKYGIADEVTSGVVVTKVESGSDAEEKGIVPGTVILEMDKRPVSDTASFNRILKDNEGKGKVLVNVRFGNFSKYVLLKVK